MCSRSVLCSSSSVWVTATWDPLRDKAPNKAKQIQNLKPLLLIKLSIWHHVVGNGMGISSKSSHDLIQFSFYFWDLFFSVDTRMTEVMV